MLERIYLDNSATTPVDPAVVEAMMPFLTGKFGNASSIHFYGQEAKAAVDRARHQVAALLNARPNEIVFTSGGTESNNLAVRGLINARASSADGRDGLTGCHVITTAIEHPAVANVCEALEKKGCSVTYLPVYQDGIVRVNDVSAAIREETVLVSVMAANNEIGTIQPVAEVGRLVRTLRNEGQKIWFHTDAVQAVGKIRVDVEEIGCDLLSLSGHKINAPKGIGALYVRRGVRLEAQNVGGRQERGLRGGTEPVQMIAALGTACEIAERRLETGSVSVAELRDRLEAGVLEAVPESSINGSREARLPNITNISFKGVEGEALLISLDMQGIAVSTGSACSSGSLEPSPVIRALGHGDEFARGAVRFSLGPQNTIEEIDRVLEVLPASVENLRRLSPRNAAAK
ncbi:MAG: cysteine desulfurase [Chloracidobacterium sp.]|nr:cysteine desulfurase [Chloracidobacterium sp.]